MTENSVTNVAEDVTKVTNETSNSKLEETLLGWLHEELVLQM